MNRHDSRQWDAQNNINVYRRDGSTVRLLHRDLEEIRRDLEKKNERLETENKRLRNIYQDMATALLHDMPRNNCEGCQLAIWEGEKLYNKMMELKGGGSGV